MKDLLLRASFAALLLSGDLARATDFTWSGASPGTTSAPVDGTWDTASTNWNGSVWGNTAADNAIFGGTGSVGITVNTGITAKSLEFTGATGSSYTLSATSAQTIALNTVSPASAVTINAGDTATIGQNVKLSLGTSSTYFISGGGTLAIGSGGSLAAVGTTYFNNSTLDILSGGAVTGSFMGTGDAGTGFEMGAINVDGGTLTLTSKLFLFAQGTAGGLDTLTLSNGALVTSATVQLTLGNSSQTAAVYLNGGTLLTGDVQNSGTAGTATAGNAYFFFNGGTLKAKGASAVFMAGLTDAYVGGDSAHANSGAVIDSNGFAITVGQVLQSGNGIEGSTSAAGTVDGGLTKLGTGTLTLSGANTYTGATTVNAGTLKAGVASVAGVSGAFGDNSAVIMANTAGAALDITGFDTQIGSLTGGGATGGNVTLGAATLTVGGDNTSPAAYAGVVSGTGRVAKIGTGTQTFSGANTYSGGTTVSSGRFLVNNATGSGTGTGGVSVANGGALGGSGIIAPTTLAAGSVAFAAGSTWAPGTAGHTDSLTLAATPGSAAGWVALTGAVNFEFNLNTGNASSYLSLTNSFSGEVAGLGAGDIFNFTDLSSGNLAPGKYTLILTDDATGNPFGSLTTLDLAGATLNGLNGYTADLEINQLAGSNDYVLQLNITSAAVPEPATWAMMLGGLGLLILVQARRRNGIRTS